METSHGEPEIPPQRKMKSTRKIEIGWVHNSRQVRPRGGGGKRRIDIDKDAGKSIILQKAKELFFPNGKSKKGTLASMSSVDLTDFKEDPVPEHVTVGDCYDQYSHGVLSFYLTTKLNTKKSCTTTPQIAGIAPGQSPGPSRVQPVGSIEVVKILPPTNLAKNVPATISISGISTHDSAGVVDVVIDDSNILRSAALSSGILPSETEQQSSGILPSDPKQQTSGILPSETRQQTSGILPSETKQQSSGILPSETKQQSSGILPSETKQQSSGILPSETKQQSSGILPSETEQQSSGILPCETEQQSSGILPSETEQQSLRILPSETEQHDLVTPGFGLLDLTDAEIAFNMNYAHQIGIATAFVNDSFQPEEINNRVVTMTVHRGHIFNNIIKYAEQHPMENIKFELKIIGQNGVEEIAEDNGGVFRDGVTEFYETFYLQYCKGSLYKVPVIRHDMDASKWEAVAKVIAIAWEQEKLFPIQLAPPFISNCMHGVCTDLVPSYMNFLPEMDRILIEDARRDFAAIDTDDIIEVLGRHDAKTIINAQNLEGVLTEMAHKDLIQVPSFVSQCWEKSMRNLNITSQQLTDIYKSLKPKTRSVLKSLKFPDVNDHEQQMAISHLKEFIRELDSTTLGLFLRFCTGSDLQIRSEITVRIIPSDGQNPGSLSRTPKAHTCGSVIEIPASYGKEPYVLFKSEFYTLLQNRYWQMDFV